MLRRKLLSFIESKNKITLKYCISQGSTLKVETSGILRIRALLFITEQWEKLEIKIQNEMLEDQSKLFSCCLEALGKSGFAQHFRKPGISIHLVFDHDRELMRKSMEAVAFAYYGEPKVAVGQQGWQSERAGHEVWSK